MKIKTLILFLIISLAAVTLSGCKKQTVTKDSLPNSKNSTVSAKNQNVDLQAAFAIYTNGVFRVFTAAMYHNLSKDAYIESDNPNIIKIKKANITWDDFFKTLPFKLTSDCLTTGTQETFCTGQNGTLKFYLNDTKTDNLLSREINQDDRALITFGNETEAQIQNQINKIPRR